MRNPAAACVVRGRFVLTQNVAPPFSFFFVVVEHPLFPLSSQPQRTDEAIAAAAAGGAAAAAGGAAVVVELLLWWSAPNSPSKLKSDI